MTDKTTEALKLAEEALDELRYANDTDIAKTKYYKALAAIRQALANQSIVLNDPHPPHRLCECTACLEYWTPLPDCDAFAASGKPIAEPVKQEPVVFEDVLEAAYWEFDARVKGYGKWKLNRQSERDAFKKAVRGIYAAPVDAKAIRAEALEQAAKVADRHSTCLNDTPNVIAAAIRGLK